MRIRLEGPPLDGEVVEADDDGIDFVEVEVRPNPGQVQVSWYLATFMRTDRTDDEGLPIYRHWTLPG